MTDLMVRRLRVLILGKLLFLKKVFKLDLSNIGKEMKADFYFVANICEQIAL